MRTDEQILHDRINLPRLVKRLEQSIQEDDWSKSTPPKRETWIKAQTTLQVSTPHTHVGITDREHLYQQIRHARLLLKNVELDNVDPTPCVHPVRPSPILILLLPAPKSAVTNTLARRSITSTITCTKWNKYASLSLSLPNPPPRGLTHTLSSN